MSVTTRLASTGTPPLLSLIVDTTYRAVFDYANPTTLKVGGTGSGGPAEAVKALKDDQCAYGFLKLTYPGGDDTTRTKFVFFSWAAPKAKALVKGKMSVHKASIKTIVQDFSLEVAATAPEDLDEAALVERVKKANY